MSECVLKVSGLGKAFRTYRSEWQRTLSWFGVSVRPAAEHWVLRGVSFSVTSGEAVGIVGQNGAGKSTLLKLITGVLRATEGDVQINGRIAAILELGMGFNPEFTGRQNVVHAAGLMGFVRKQIEQAMPEIEAFAEIGEYFDQPLRTYSSGMQMRVAFAVATAFRPEILIVDEALSVGDAYFQHKSFDRIRQFKEQGTALLFVTHGMGDVRSLCDRVILLDKGTVLKDGLPDEVVDYYNALIAEKENAKLSIEQRRHQDGWLLTKSGTGECSIVRQELQDAETFSPVQVVRVGQRLKLVLDVEIRAPIPSLVLGYMLRDRQGHVVWGTNTWHTKQRLQDLRQGQRLRYELDFMCLLGPGAYAFIFALSSTDTHLVDNYEWTDNALVFEVINADRPSFIGCNFIEAEIRVEIGTQ
jgi:lipopolysaccharide transport system ATP-binding protein